MTLRHTTSIIASFLIASGYSALTMSQSMLSENDAQKFVLVDTAYTDTPEYVINRAEDVKTGSHSFIGPGPIHITFHAEMSQQPSYYCWELAEDNRFENVIDQFRMLGTSGTISEFDYNFESSGTYYIRFVADFISDNNATFPYATENPYLVQITESLLEIPNLITPDNTESRISVFHVKYKSLRSYEIWIHNRWGQQLFHSTNPEEGWDGRSGGKTVPTGAYYYLVKAEGTDGVKYNKKGAVNVLRTRDNSSTNNR